MAAFAVEAVTGANLDSRLGLDLLRKSLRHRLIKLYE